MATSGTGAGSNRESQILTAQKLTQRLGKSSVEGKFGKDDVLDVLRGVSKLLRCERSVWRDFSTLRYLLFSILMSNVSSLFFDTSRRRALVLDCCERLKQKLIRDS